MYCKATQHDFVFTLRLNHMLVNWMSFSYWLCCSYTHYAQYRFTVPYDAFVYKVKSVTTIITHRLCI